MVIYNDLFFRYFFLSESVLKFVSPVSGHVQCIVFGRP